MKKEISYKEYLSGSTNIDYSKYGGGFAKKIAYKIYAAENMGTLTDEFHMDNINKIISRL
jgi:hypothetical protein